MAKILKKVGTATNTPTNYYEADTVRDMYAIDTTYVQMGARCYVIQESQLYALDSHGAWFPVPMGGGSTPVPGTEIIYDGGDIDSVPNIVYDGGNIG